MELWMFLGNLPLFFAGLFLGRWAARSGRSLADAVGLTVAAWGVWIVAGIVVTWGLTG